jgi:hypothetical protein
VTQLDNAATAAGASDPTNSPKPSAAPACKFSASLGPDVSKELDAHLAYEFAPHIKLKKMAAPTAPAVAQAGN